VVDALTDPVFVVDGRGHLVGWNDAAEAATGYDASTLGDAPLSLLFDEATVSRLTAAVERVGPGERTLVESSLVDAEGSRLPHEFEVSALVDAGGAAVVVCRPVTDHQQSLERVSDAFFSLDEDWRLTYVNETAFPILRDAMDVEADEVKTLLGRNLWDEIPEAVDTEFYERYHEAIRTGEPTSFEARYEPLAATFDVRAYPSQSGLSVYLRDVTERREYETSLERQATTLREMYEIIADRSLSFDEQVGRLLAVGRSTLDADYGVLARIDGERWTAEVVDVPEGTISVGDVYPLSATNCERTVTTEQTLVLGDVAEDAPDLAERDGVTEWGVACYLGAPVHVDDEVYGTFCFYDTEPRDGFDDWEVTVVDLMSRWVGAERERERRTERLERQNERLDSFASFVSHDLRGPLSALRGWLDMAEETGDPEQFAKARDAADRMESLIDDLLVLARVGDLSGDRERVALATAARTAWRGVETGDARLVVETDRALLADPGPFEQLLVNLFRNSVEHGSTGDDPVTVTVGETPDGFYVADDGPGVPEDERERVLDSGYSTDREGTGFGLAIVREVATAHGWDVSLGAAESGGLRVEFSGV